MSGLPGSHPWGPGLRLKALSVVCVGLAGLVAVALLDLGAPPWVAVLLGAAGALGALSHAVTTGRRSGTRLRPNPPTSGLR